MPRTNARTYTPEEIAVLKRNLIRAFESLLTKYPFKPGQLVRWKEGLKNKRLPERNAPAIVWETLLNPIFDNSKTVVAGSLYFKEPLDIVLGVMDEDEFVLFHYDSRRLEPIPE
ncbi:MAG TPA: hypothetical protein VIK59_07600 [Verrucomicrobiae bacterium]